MKAENSENRDCPQRDSAEQEGYVEVRRSFRSIWEERDSALSSRRSVQSIRPALEKVKVYELHIRWRST